MFKIKTFNQIATKGLNALPKTLYEVGSEVSDPCAILLRSHPLSDADLPPQLQAVARAGAGYNNVPVEALTKRGVVVFNTPGANANSVKELVVAALLIRGRHIHKSQTFMAGLGKVESAEALHKQVEAEKKQFKGIEIAEKTLGIVGLGAIGSQVANAALGLGMKVLGYDPALSVEAAWRMSSAVKRMDSLEALFSQSDFISLHVPLLEDTQGMISTERLKSFRPGSTLLNYSREAIVDVHAVVEALDSGKLGAYFTDFPTPELLGRDDVFLTPHLGASTAEAEENCAVMAAKQLRNFLENGNITNAVNFPQAELERSSGWRFAVINHNVPNMLGQITGVLAEHNVNVMDMLNKSRHDIAYSLIDVEGALNPAQLQTISNIEGVVNVRCFSQIML